MTRKPLSKVKKTTGIKSWQKITAAVILVAAAAFIIINLLTEEEPVQNQYLFKKEGELVFIDSSGTELKKIDIEIAEDEYERQLGLMFRENMNENQGMLFIFPYQSMQSFWMSNTLISLDIIFINNQKKIVTIHKGTNILSEQSYPSSDPAQYVVEVIAGFTDKYNIKTGDRINWMSTKIDIK
jgi:hypothetical protein